MYTSSGFIVRPSIIARHFRYSNQAQKNEHANNRFLMKHGPSPKCITVHTANLEAAAFVAVLNDENVGTCMNIIIKDSVRC